MDFIKCVFISLTIFTMSFSPLALAQKKGKAKKKDDASFDLRKLVLPSDIKGMGKTSGAIYYSPTTRGKVLIPVHFWGDVGRTGLHYLPIDTNLVNALSFAGGPGSNAVMEDIQVTRKKKGVLVTQSFNLEDGGSDEAHSFTLKPEDTVFIKQSTFQSDRAYYTSLIGVIATVLSSILLYRQVRRDNNP